VYKLGNWVDLDNHFHFHYVLIPVNSAFYTSDGVKAKFDSSMYRFGVTVVLTFLHRRES